MKTILVRGFLLAVFFALVYSNVSLAAVITFDWKGSSITTWASASAWTASDGSTTNYPGSGGRTTDIVRFGVTGSSYTKQPTLTSSLTIASIEFGGGIETAGTKLTVTGVTLTVGTITQDINTTSSSNTIFDYLQGTGTISCTTITVGSGTNTTGTFNFLLSDIATLNVTGNVVIKSNVNKQNGCGFRLEDGDMYLGGVITFTTVGTITATNASYFTINTVAQAGGNTTPHLYLSNANPIGTIPSPHASVNFYGDRGGTGDVTYTAASPTIYTTSTAGFGSGGGTIDTTKSAYDNLTIQGTGTATIGGTSVGALKVTGNFTTASPAVFSSAAATNTSIGGNWINSSTISGNTGTTAVTGNLTNSGAMTLSSGAVDVGGNISNTGTLTAGPGDLQVDGSLTNSSALTLSSGDLTIEGNYTNSAGGTFTAGTGTVYFSGATAESLTDNSTTGTTLNNVDFKGGGTKTLSGSGSFAVSTTGVLTMEAGNILQTGGILTLNSSSSGSATVAAIPSNSSITGTVNVQRYISGGSNTYRSYRLLSSPVYTSSSASNYYFDLSYLTSYSPITGSGGTAGGLTKSGNPSVYLYRDNMAFTNSTYNTGNFRGINKINNSPLYSIGVDYDGSFNLHVGTGVMFFYRGNLSNIATKYITTTSAEANVFMSTGTLNQQAVTVVNWYTQLPQLQYSVVTGNTGYSGYNLVGNPYASSIDWNSFSATSSAAGIYGPNVGTTIYIFNEVSKVYATYNAGLGTNGGSNIIPSGQGFFVKATGAGTPTLTFNESAKTNSQLTGPTQATGTTLLLSATPLASSVLQYLRLELAADSINKDETLVRFSSSAKNEYVINEDAQYFPGSGEVSLSGITPDSVMTAINTIPFPKKNPTIVRLNVNAIADGVYKLNMTEMKAIPGLFEVWLMDAYRKDSVDMRHNPSYSFDIFKADTNSYGSKRFSLVIRQNAALGIHLLSFTGSKAGNTAHVVWKAENEANYTNFTVERSSDGGLTYNELGGLPSNDQGTYSFVDNGPPAAADMYRLEIEDLNGTITYSNAVTLMFGNTTTSQANTGISIFPNPATSLINVSVTPASVTQSSGLVTASLDAQGPASANVLYKIDIVNMNGGIIKSVIANQSGLRMDVSGLASGAYIMRVTNKSNDSLVGQGTFVKQ